MTTLDKLIFLACCLIFGAVAYIWLLFLCLWLSEVI